MYQHEALVFSALSDATRLQIIVNLVNGDSYPIRDITALTNISRQAVTKHLRVLEHAGLVIAEKRGRESHFTVSPDGLAPIQTYLATIEKQWDIALERLKLQVE